jgi:hypothetical protein
MDSGLNVVWFTSEVLRFAQDDNAFSTLGPDSNALFGAHVSNIAGSKLVVQQARSQFFPTISNPKR